MIAAHEVAAIIACLRAARVPVWLDGGWGVDALVGEQTRPHDDLDLVVALDDSETVLSALSTLGFILADDERPTRFVVRDTTGRRVDLHTVSFHADGSGVQRLQDGSAWRYPPQGFTGIGHVNGTAVPCLTAEVQMLCHQGYIPDATDDHDVALLVERCGVARPAAFAS